MCRKVGEKAWTKLNTFKHIVSTEYGNCAKEREGKEQKVKLLQKGNESMSNWKYTIVFLHM